MIGTVTHIKLDKGFGFISTPERYQNAVGFLHKFVVTH